MKSKNTKVNRTLSTLAAVLKDCEDDLILEIHEMINDNLDGYDFDFIQAVNSYRSFMADGKRIAVKVPWE